jgi:hypothetical protein
LPDERGYACLTFGRIRAKIHQHANPPHPFGLLRAHGERPRGRRRTADKGDEVAPLHVSLLSTARSVPKA